MKKTIVLSVVLLYTLAPLFVSAQGNRGVIYTNDNNQVLSGNTYALIVGINYANRKNFPHLDYAVEDAKLLKSFLQSGLFFDSLPDKNIKIISDQQATAANLWYGFDWLSKAANKGDNAIIYFAGHGIASGPSLGFLIAYDAPDVTDPSQFGFQGGAIPVYQLKQNIEDLKTKGVTTFLITDACRNNERNDSLHYNFENIMESNKGEIQFSSCSRNQSSMENKRWGGGHGLFTYYLIKGLSGAADSEGFKDGHVTLSELQFYLMKHVEDDSRDLVTNRPKQIPYINLTNASDQNQTISFAKPWKNLDGQLQEQNMLDVTSRGLFNDTSALFKDYLKALDKNLFFEEQKGNAYSLLIEIKRSAPQDDYDDAVQQYIIHLLNDAQLRINKYFEGVDTNYTSKYFSTGARELNIALGLMSKEHPLYKIYNVNRLFMESRSLREGFSSYSLAESKIDSAIAINNNLSYLYHAKGLIASDQLKWDTAITLFKKAHELKPDWWFPEIQLANCYLAIKEDAKAKGIYWEAVSSDSLNAEKWNTLGAFFANKRLYDSAVFCYQKAIIANPQYSYSLKNLANIYSFYSDTVKARYFFWRAIHADSLNTGCWNDFGSFYLNRKLYDSAATCFKRAIKIDPSYSVSFRNLGNLYKYTNRDELARRMLLMAIKEDSLNTGNWNDLGAFYWNKKNYDSAIICYKKAVYIDPYYSLSIRNLGNIYKARNQDAVAKKLFYLAIERDSTNASNWNELGVFFESRKLLDSAIYCYKKAIAVDPASSLGLRNLGDLYKNNGQPAPARKLLLKATQVDPYSADNWNDLGVFYMGCKNYDSAIIAYKNAVAIDPTYSLSLRNLGLVYETLNKDTLAKQVYWQAVYVDPSNAENWNELGFFYNNKKNNDSAIAYYKKANLVDPNYSLSLKNLGFLYQTLKKDTLAKQLFYRAISVDSLNADIWNGMGVYYHKAKKYDSAKTYYQKAFLIDPNSTLSLRNLALLYEDTNNDTLAIQAYYQAISIEPFEIKNFNGFALFLYDKKDYDSAIIYYKKALTIDTGSAKSYYGIGRIFLDKKDYPNSITYFRKALSLDTTNTDYLDYTGYAYTYADQFDKGHYYFQKTIALDTSNWDGYYNEACVYARQKDIQNGFKFLELSLIKGFTDVDHIKTDEDLTNLRAYPQFDALLKKYFP